jgi:hypothetical protein
LLTYGDYSQTFRRNRDFGADGCIKELFHPTNARGNFDGTRTVFNALVSAVNENDVRGSLKRIIAAYLRDCHALDWRYYFIKYAAATGGVYGRYIWWHKRRGYNFQSVFFTDAPYEIVLLFKDQLKGQGWNVFLRILSRDSRISKHVSIGNYANSDENKLLINKTGEKIDCLNDHYEIVSSAGTTVATVPIPQNGNHIDIEDRIEIGVATIQRIISSARQ